MRRPERPGRLRDKIAWLRAEIPDLVLRTTVVVGFPSERDEDFDQLLDFVGEIQFDHLGAFAFSPQPGTPGAEMPDPVPESLKMERLSQVNDLQRSIVAARNAARIGSRVEAVVDRIGDPENGRAPTDARIRGQAYEIDGQTYLEGSDVRLEPGDLVNVTITGADDADLWAVVQEQARVGRPAAPVGAAPGLDLTTVWGR